MVSPCTWVVELPFPLQFFHPLSWCRLVHVDDWVILNLAHHISWTVLKSIRRFGFRQSAHCIYPLALQLSIFLSFANNLGAFSHPKLPLLSHIYSRTCGLSAHDSHSFGMSQNAKNYSSDFASRFPLSGMHMANFDYA